MRLFRHIGGDSRRAQKRTGRRAGNTLETEFDIAKYNL
ncbi:hypothetical protein BN903_7 [Halorubrum sp. AJ67]|nr:hypothetical protein BN903_7 [Halorubrum sp. AJ67]